MPETPDAVESRALPREYNVPLLRLRLLLALLTMAVLPTVLAMALVHTSMVGQSVADTLRLQERTRTVSRLIEARLDRVAVAARMLAADGVLATAADNPASTAVHVRTLLRHTHDTVSAVAVLDGRGVELIDVDVSAGAARTQPGAARTQNGGGPSAIDRLAEGDLDIATVATADGLHELLVTAPIISQPGAAQPGAGRRVAAVRLTVPLGQLLAAVANDLGSPADLMLVNSDGSLLGRLSAGAGADGAPSSDALLAGLADARDLPWAPQAGWRVTADTLPEVGWAIVSVDRISEPELPIALLALLIALCALLAAMIVWMSKQVLGPAQELARSRQSLLEMYETARADALHDALTGLGNHRAFQEELAHQLEWYQRYQVPVALLLIDLDDLKLINDTEGHAAGDQVMREMGRLITSIARYADRAFRVGGDEFAILMPHTTTDGALELGRRLLGQAMQNPTRPIRFSGGISACPALGATRDQLFAQADAALYWCKRHGRASIDIFDPLRDAQANDEATASQSTHIARVIANGLLRAVYQPVVDLRRGTVIGFEGLIRPLPESGFADPGSLFAAADAVGRTVELDHACLETVLAQAHGLGPQQQLNVNLSPRTIEAPEFSVDWLLAVLAGHGYSANRIVVEVTEHDDIEDLPRLQRNLAALQRAGIRVAIDDVGAGNAGLRLLSQFRFDVVKIDLSLVQDGTRHNSSRAVLTSLHELAGRWRAYVVAEGIETASQLRVVRELGMAAGQGYLLGRPMPMPRLTHVDLAAIQAGGVVLEARAPTIAVDLPAPEPGAA